MASRIIIRDKYPSGGHETSEFGVTMDSPKVYDHGRTRAGLILTLISTHGDCEVQVVVDNNSAADLKDMLNTIEIDRTYD